MRLAILNATGGGMSGGYRKYLLNVIPRMASHREVEALLCLSPAALEVSHWFHSYPDVTFVDYQPYGVFSYLVDQKVKESIRAFCPDVIFMPIALTSPVSDIPVVTMLQNMGPLLGSLEGDSTKDRLRKFVQRVIANRALKKSARVIAISGFVRDFLIENWNIPSDRIGLVYFGTEFIGESKYSDRPGLVPSEWAGNFLFTAGSIRPARGLEDLLNALEVLSKERMLFKGLVIAGEVEQGMTGYREILTERIKRNGLESLVCWAGHLNEKEMHWCYTNCGAFIMSSRVEACPNVVLEAMAHGCLCITADNPPLPEIFSDTAVLYPPRDGQALSKAIVQILEWDCNKKKYTSERTRARAFQFNWATTVEKTIAELQKAINGGSS